MDCEGRQGPIMGEQDMTLYPSDSKEGRMIRYSHFLLAAIIGFIVVGCTTVGIHDPTVREQFRLAEEMRTVRLCAYLDDGITLQQVQTLLADAWDADVEGVGIRWEIVDAGSWPRSGFTYFSLREAADSLPLLPHCDRAMLFLGRHFGDVLWGLAAIVMPLPEVSGYVDDEAHLRGYVVATRATLLQVIWMTPVSTLRHELYHMLGCGHGSNLAPCYPAIRALKAASRG